MLPACMVNAKIAMMFIYKNYHYNVWAEKEIRGI